MRRLFLTLIVCTCACLHVHSTDLYIVNDFFDMVLTANSSGEPRLSSYSSANDEAFIYEAIESGTEGYVLLRHKQSGQYLTASTSNSWSVILSDEAWEIEPSDEYLWELNTRFSTTIVSKKNTSCRLGCDFSSGSTYYWSSTYVPVYYNKSAGALNWFTVVPSNGEGYTASLAAMESDAYTDEYGILRQEVYQVTQPVSVQGLDYHIVSDTPIDGTGSVNLEDRSAWLVFDNVRPSSVISSWLKYVTIGGAAAKNGTNCRVEIYLRGAAVIPTCDDEALVATTDEGSFAVPLGNTSDLGSNSNKARSFVLKRGYMATVATEAGGEDYSRVYVADHADLEVTLPNPLDQRISSVYVRKWHYNAKGGYPGSDTGAAAAAGGTWWWNWDANSSSTNNLEYIPIKQHLYWPSDGNFYNSTYTAMMMLNEPNHSEQHSGCSCGGTVSAWTAYTHTPKFNATGLRIGSPAETTISYIKEYLTYCDNMKQRCDFACVHGYWTTEWSSDFYTLIGYGRPVWITEWKYGASWTTSYTPSGVNEYAAKVLTILDQLEYNENVERYSYYGVDTGGTNGWMTALFWDCNYLQGTTPTGSVYKRVKPHHGYKQSKQVTPNWWAPTMTAPTIDGVAALPDGTYSLSVTNSYGDNAATLTALMQSGDEWVEVGAVTDRSELDNTSLTIDLSGDVEAGSTIKLLLTSLYGTTEKESDEFTIPLYKDFADLQNLTFDEGTFVTQSVCTYDYDCADGQTSGMQDVDGWKMAVTNGNARASGQWAWGSDCFMGGKDYLAPAADSQGNTDGGAFGVVSVWTAQTQYVQYVLMPAGDYEVEIPIYNAGGTVAFDKNLFGFITDDGIEWLFTNTTYPEGEWTTEKMAFTLDEDTYGKLSLGYTAVNLGSGSMPHLFADYVGITYTAPVDGVASPTSQRTEVYDLTGRKVSKPAKGIYISGGKKICTD